MTKYAKQILDLINNSDEHLSAEQIYLRLKQTSPKLVLATVYNNLHQLHQQELIRKISVEGCPDRYDKTVKHDHLVCKRCGALSDVTLSDLTAQLQAQIQAPIFSYDLKISYLCPACRSDEPAAHSPDRNR